MRIDKFLADCSNASRKDIKTFIKNARVSVNGKVVRDSGMHVSESEEVRLDGEVIKYVQYIYLMLNKPAGVISATYDGRHQTVIDLVPEKFAHYDVFPVGRLDIDTTGLLILTNDGALAHRLTSPKHHADKRYSATIDSAVDENDVKAFYEGIELDDGYVCKSADLEVVSCADSSEIELVIREGKFHQVKRMFEARGKKVLRLKRLSMGGVWLDENLPEGQMRLLSQEEIDILKSN